MNKRKTMAILLAIIVVAFNMSNIINNTKSVKTNVKDNILNTLTKDKTVKYDDVIKSKIYDSAIAVLTIDTPIQADDRHRFLMDKLEDIRHSDNIKAVILKLDTPGGGVYESAQIADKIQQIKKERSIPFYASMQSVAASGGYYIAAVCDKIYASNETITGSIGVIMKGINYSQLMQKYGITQDVVKTGAFKDMGSPTKPISPEDKAIFQELINNSYTQFVNIVSKGRKLSIDEVMKLADGRIYDGRQALKLKLIDKIGYYETVEADLKKDLSLKSPQIIDYSYTESVNGLLSFLNIVSDNVGKTELQKNLDALKNMNYSMENKPMYLYGGM